MYYREHAPPHFHAEYAGEEVLISIRDLSVLRGRINARALGLIMEWATLHQDELLHVWELARDFEPLPSIDPLQ
jgi:hypothetical protein